MEQQREDWTDIGYTVTGVNHENIVDIKVYRIDSPAGEEISWAYEDRGLGLSTYDFSQADVLGEVVIKADGCSDWNIGYHHLCHGQKSIDNFGEMIKRVGQWANGLMT